ncbi:unnamed protein product [Clavelina lepadiformis]|uniref:Uncharacterized protein n=1 Tax=Clavelina lepadiformis TaxID=159417 RepID=A0ABP0FEW5_CLALP
MEEQDETASEERTKKVSDKARQLSRRLKAMQKSPGMIEHDDLEDEEEKHKLTEKRHRIRASARQRDVLQGRINQFQANKDDGENVTPTAVRRKKRTVRISKRGAPNQEMSEKFAEHGKSATGNSLVVDAEGSGRHRESVRNIKTSISTRRKAFLAAQKASEEPTKEEGTQEVTPKRLSRRVKVKSIRRTRETDRTATTAEDGQASNLGTSSYDDDAEERDTSQLAIRPRKLRVSRITRFSSPQAASKVTQDEVLVPKPKPRARVRGSARRAITKQDAETSTLNEDQSSRTLKENDNSAETLGIKPCKLRVSRIARFNERSAVPGNKKTNSLQLPTESLLPVPGNEAQEVDVGEENSVEVHKPRKLRLSKINRFDGKKHKSVKRVIRASMRHNEGITNRIENLKQDVEERQKSYRDMYLQNYEENAGADTPEDDPNRKKNSNRKRIVRVSCRGVPNLSSRTRQLQESSEEASGNLREMQNKRIEEAEEAIKRKPTKLTGDYVVLSSSSSDEDEERSNKEGARHVEHTQDDVQNDAPMEAGVDENVKEELPAATEKEDADGIREYKDEDITRVQIKDDEMQSTASVNYNEDHSRSNLLMAMQAVQSADDHTRDDDAKENLSSAISVASEGDKTTYDFSAGFTGTFVLREPGDASSDTIYADFLKYANLPGNLVVDEEFRRKYREKYIEAYIAAGHEPKDVDKVKAELENVPETLSETGDGFVAKTTSSDDDQINTAEEHPEAILEDPEVNESASVEKVKDLQNDSEKQFVAAHIQSNTSCKDGQTESAEEDILDSNAGTATKPQLQNASPNQLDSTLELEKSINESESIKNIALEVISGESEKSQPDNYEKPTISDVETTVAEEKLEQVPNDANLEPESRETETKSAEDKTSTTTNVNPAPDSSDAAKMGEMNAQETVSNTEDDREIKQKKETEEGHQESEETVDEKSHQSLDDEELSTDEGELIVEYIYESNDEENDEEVEYIEFEEEDSNEEEEQTEDVTYVYVDEDGNEVEINQGEVEYDEDGNQIIYVTDSDDDEVEYISGSDEEEIIYMDEDGNYVDADGNIVDYVPGSDDEVIIEE